MKGALPEVVDLARLKLWGCGGAGVEVEGLGIKVQGFKVVSGCVGAGV